LAQVEGADAEWFLGDALGSMRQLVDDQGGILKCCFAGGDRRMRSFTSYLPVIVLGATLSDRDLAKISDRIGMQKRGPRGPQRRWNGEDQLT
jgi:hypothetical protein